MYARQRQLRWWFLGSAVPLLLLVAFFLGILPDRALVAPHGHFVFISIVSVLSLVIAVLVLAAAVQITDFRVLALALAFLSLSGFLSIHGLTTPGVIGQELNSWFSSAARLALFGGAWFLAASALESHIAAHRLLLLHRWWIVFSTSVVLAVYGTAGVSDLLLQRSIGLDADGRAGWLARA